MSALAMGIVGGLGSAITWAAISILARTLSDRMTPAGINAFRSTVGGLAVLALAVASGYGGEIVRMPLWAVLALWLSISIGFAMGDTLFFEGMRYLGVTRAHTLSMVHPLLSTLVGIGLFGEPITPRRALGILLVLTGIALIVTGHEEVSGEAAGGRRRGIRLVLGAAVAWTLAAVLLKAPLRAVSAMAATAVRSPLGGLALWATPWTRGTWGTVCKSRGREVGFLAAICLLSAASSLLFTTGIKYGGVAVGTVLSTTSPLFTIPLEVIVLGHRPTRRTIQGAVTTVVGIALMN
jgi:drug/metabolite transporter (DMT)-like permease